MRVSLGEALGLRPVTLAVAQARMTFAGDAYVPKSRFGVSSLGMIRPGLSLATWLGRRRPDRRIPIFNLVNRTPTPVEAGWSVRRTQLRDFRGKTLTYDSHNGTDFCVPPGTTVVASAPGRVLSERREFHRGGLKLYVDHWHGLVTTYNHLSRALVTVGARVERGEPIALSGASGIDSTLTFPWAAPHVHYNVWLNGVAADPFAAPGEVALWRAGNAPVPSEGPSDDDAESPESFAAERVERVLAQCRDPRFVSSALAIADVDQRAVHVLVETITFPTRFSVPEAGRGLYGEPAPRSPRLDLPFLAEEFVGVWFPDED
jgi:murein DD-endopeptidase MepM/ murein hydrolase activator NlpD